MLKPWGNDASLLERRIEVDLELVKDDAPSKKIRYVLDLGDCVGNGYLDPIAEPAWDLVNVRVCPSAAD